MMKVLVTGASGFVGSALCRSLAAGPFQVVGQVRSLCNPVTGVEYVRAELKESTKLDAALRGVECVVHLAGRAHIFGRQRDSLDIFRKVNRDATLALARQAIEASVKRFIFVSSIGVNGALTKEKPFDENSKPAPHAEYAISKFEAEVALRELFKQFSTELVIVRPPLVYDWNAPGNFSRLLKLVASGLPLPFGCIDNRRSFVSLDNLVDFLACCMTHPSAAGELFLVSDGQEISTKQLVTALAAGMGRRPIMWPVPRFILRFLKLVGKGGLYTQLCCSLEVDSSKGRLLLGWEPRKSTLSALEDVGRIYVKRTE